MLLFWPLIGAVLGAYAAEKKGFSVFGGILFGLIFGPFTVILFFVSGVYSRDEWQRKCPHCAEQIKPEAKVCRFCGRDVPAKVVTKA